MEASVPKIDVCAGPILDIGELKRNRQAERDPLTAREEPGDFVCAAV